MTRKHASHRAKVYQQIRNRKMDQMQELALERIHDLFHRAIAIYDIDPNLAHRYISLCRGYAMSVKISLPRAIKQQICHGCKHLLLVGKTSRIRIHHRPHYATYISVTCLQCHHITRYLLKGRATRGSIPSGLNPLSPVNTTHSGEKTS